MEILGGIVLMDPDTDEPYAAPHTTLSDSEQYGVGVLGTFVLIDPETDQPYKLV